MLGMSQRELAVTAEVKQPLIAAVESGRRRPSDAVRQSLQRALALRPSQALAARHDEVRAAFERAGLPPPRVFGSVARGEDLEGSDVDLLVDFTDRHDIADLLALADELAQLLAVGVDLVDARAVGEVLERTRSEAVSL
jgi:predicted nucleotidyltransferase